MNNEKVQQAVDEIILTIRARGWKYSETTKKALRELDDLGLTPFVTSRDLPCAEIINEIIKQAKFAGKTTTESGWAGEDGYLVTINTDASDLYKALNETVPEPTPEPEPTKAEDPITRIADIRDEAKATYFDALQITLDACKTYTDSGDTAAAAAALPKVEALLTQLDALRAESATINAQKAMRGDYLTPFAAAAWQNDLFSMVDELTAIINPSHEDHPAARHFYTGWLPKARTYGLVPAPEAIRYTTEQAAELLGVSQQAVQRAISRRTLKAYKQGRDYIIEAGALETYRKFYLRKPGRKTVES